MGTCKYCGESSITISSVVSVCVNCLRRGHVPPEDPHRYSRERFHLPLVESGGDGFKCSVCGRGCVISTEGGRGYCGYRVRVSGFTTVSTRNPLNAVGLYYYDPHPTNCVALPVCPAATGLGYPEYALSPAGEHGYYNIAVFYGGCNLDCLYCQNWEYREMAVKAKPVLSVESLVNAVNSRTTCVCYFGGDPGPFAPHALIASRKMIERARSIGLRVFRVCWETNGLWNPTLLEKAALLSLETGGIVKIDFKAWSPEVYRALCGVEEKHVKLIRENIRLVASLFNKRLKPPLLVVSMLLVPGYVDEYEIEQATKFVAQLNPEIPYIFLGFHPDYLLLDLPTTSRRHAEKAVKIARENGLKNVWVENVFLLGSAY
ncbi:MAG: radical SAM protein [Desulfurococcaceae archaeon]|nr:radical SAM protein [Desulfurococcaceae archaeon]